MENEIKVGEFIRTDDGRIYRLEDLEDELYLSDKFYNNIVKHSPNLIDLIECGDYVNGQKITKITNDPFIKGQIDLWTDRTIPFDGDYQQERFINEEIETIVTKEQFVSMEYKVKE